MTQLNHQETFDRVARHLFAQGKRALGKPDKNGRTYCRYRGEGGTSCAIGCLILDQYYSLDFEGKIVGCPEVCEALGKSLGLEGILEPDDHLFFSLQPVHDNPASWQTTETMRHALERVGKEHNLDTTFLTDLGFSGR